MQKPFLTYANQKLHLQTVLIIESITCKIVIQNKGQ